VLLRGFFCS